MATPIAHKGVIAGAKAQAMTVLDLLTKPELVKQAWDYFNNVQTKDAEVHPVHRQGHAAADLAEQGDPRQVPPRDEEVLLRPDKYPTYLDQLGNQVPDGARRASHVRSRTDARRLRRSGSAKITTGTFENPCVTCTFAFLRGYVVSFVLRRPVSADNAVRRAPSRRSISSRRVVEMRRDADAAAARTAAGRDADLVLLVERRDQLARVECPGREGDDGAGARPAPVEVKIVKPSIFAQAGQQLLRQRLRALLDRRASDLGLKRQRLARTRSSWPRRAARTPPSCARCRPRQDRRCTRVGQMRSCTRVLTNSTPHSRAPHGHLCALPE